MTARLYFAWKMMMEAAEGDRREAERRDKAQWRNLCQVNRVSDKKFVQLYRLTKTAFIYLCKMLRENSDLKGSQRVSLETKVLSALLFYAKGDYQSVVGEARHLGQQTVSKYVHEVTEALNHPNVVRKYIKFPDTLEARQQLKQNFYNMHGFPGVLGCIDGSHFRIFMPQKDEEHMYYCRKHYHSLNVQMVADHQGRILAINPKFGGASHDAFVWENSSINSFMQSLHQNAEPVWLLGDSGYPQRPWLMTPYSNTTPNSAEETYIRVHGRTRVIIENTFGRLKNRWRCVCKDRVLHYKPAKCAKIIITACSVLHNIALDFRVPQEDVAVDEESNVPTHSSYAEHDQSMLNLGRQLRDRVAMRLHTVTTI